MSTSVGEDGELYNWQEGWAEILAPHEEANGCRSNGRVQVYRLDGGRSCAWLASRS
jgi:hypothetical protein